MDWIEGPNVPPELEGRAAWKWYEGWCGNKTPIFDRIPRGFSRDPHHCGGVWFMLAEPPTPPERR